MPCKVNIIEYNPIDDGMFQQADRNLVDEYLRQLEKHHISTTVIRSSGKDIDAACGQLANES